MTASTAAIPFPLPRYGDASLAELLPSVLAAAGIPDELNVLSLEGARRSCILLIDGLGWELLREYGSVTPFLTELMERGRVLTAAFPTTTATCLASFGTGRPPGGHGVLGYQVAVPGEHRLLNALDWDESVVPEIWQPVPTAFERAAAHGALIAQVGPGAFRNGGLTRAALRGAEYVGAESPADRAKTTVRMLAIERATVVYTYFGDVDHAGHVHGCGSREWLAAAAEADRLARAIADSLPADGVLYVTADHGMINIPPGARIDVDIDPALAEGVALLGGDPRARHVYAVPGAAAEMLGTWREVLAGRAVVMTRDEATEAGLFGPVADWAAPRIGDVVAVCRNAYAVVATQREPVESALVAMHGGLTAAELAIPLLEYRP